MKRSILGLAFILLGATFAQASCQYSLRSQELLQCKAIQQINGAWTYVDEPHADEETLAHVYCTCQTALTSPGAGCDAAQTRHLTFTVPTQDIRSTCAPGADICEKPCLKLLKQAPSLQD